MVASHANELGELQNSITELRQELLDQSSELEKVMEELEYYFLQSRQQLIMLAEHAKLQERATALITNSLS